MRTAQPVGQAMSIYKARPLLIIAAFLVLLLASCAAGPNEMANTPSDNGTIAGFWLGLWHGIISPVTFLVSLFFKNVHLYEIHNNGGWYNFGFVLGAGIFLGGGSRAARRCGREKH